jgi:hypothetical protein
MTAAVHNSADIARRCTSCVPFDNLNAVRAVSITNLPFLKRYNPQYASHLPPAPADRRATGKPVYGRSKRLAVDAEQPGACAD